MAKVKKSKKGLIATISVVLAVVIIITSVVIVKIKTDKTEVTLTEISTGSISETVEGTGTITAGAVKDYKVQAVANVKEVYVKTGDRVKEGDLLASFDTESLDAQIKTLESSYNSAKASYNNAVKNQKTAKSNLSNTDKQIKALEKKKEQIKNSLTNKTAKSSASVQTYSTYDASSLGDVLSKIAEELQKITDDVETLTKLLQTITDEIINQIENGNIDPDKIAQAVADAVSKLIEQGLDGLKIDKEEILEIIKSAIKSVDWQKIVKQITDSDSVALASTEIQLASLYAQKAVFKTQADGTLVSAQKTALESTKSALDVVKSQSESMRIGWKASFDGVITSCDLVAGEQTSLLSKGIRLENTDSLTVTISLGKQDAQKVKVGMPVKVDNGNFEGEVTFVSPTASGGAGSSILDSVGSIAGVSGLSSLTSSGAGVDCQITIKNPDSSLIVGFDTDVSISTGEYNDIVVVPIESLVLEKTGSYVYLYNEAESTVKKVQIETGATSDTIYQVVSGINAGDKIVTAPTSVELEDDQKVKVVDKLKEKKSNKKNTSSK
ncbi:MAG: hypothetical protein DBY14_01485 [Escherichia coli]|nr:MAG: hypothetical protein DBY14_01485 [Escherichia coli]